MRLFCSFLLFISALAAESADWIWTARYVVTMDAQRRVIENGAIAIGGERGERILAAGPRAEIERQYQPRQRLDRPDAILAPGLIDTHTHAAMSLFRGIADDLRLQDWLEHYIFPAEARNVTPEFVRWGTRLGCLEMLLSGTTTYTDMYYFEDVVAEATEEAGMRGVLGETIIGFPSPDAKTPKDALAFTEPVPHPFSWRPADRARRRAARHLYQFGRDAQSLPGARQPAWRAGPDSSFGNQARERRVDGEAPRDPHTGARQAGLLQWPHRRGARCLGGRSRSGDPEITGRGDRALPIQQHEAGERHRAGHAHAGAGSAGGPGPRWPRRQQQRFQHV